MARFIPPIFLLVWHLVLLFGGGIVVWELNFGGLNILDVVKMVSVCSFAGLTGGVMYCMRGIYLNFCVSKRWDSDWVVWHLIRPWVSAICGVVCYFFLQAGLLLLKSKENVDFSPYVYYVLSFLAGLNVEKFISKLEEVGKAVIGIGKSRATKDSEKNKAP